MSESKSEDVAAAPVDAKENPAVTSDAHPQPKPVVLVLEPMEAQALDALLEIAIKAGGRQIAQAVMVLSAKLSAAQRAAG